MDKQIELEIMHFHQEGYSCDEIAQLVNISHSRVQNILVKNSCNISAHQKRKRYPTTAFTSREKSVYKTLISTRPEQHRYLSTEKQGWNMVTVRAVMEKEGIAVISGKEVIRLLKKCGLLLQRSPNSVKAQRKPETEPTIDHAEFRPDPEITTEFSPGIRFIFYSYDPTGNYTFMVYKEYSRQNSEDIPLQTMEEDFMARIGIRHRKH